MLPYHDPEGILSAGKKRTAWYPDELAEAIFAYKYPVACTLHASYRSQIARAVELNDPVALNHRVAEFLACVFDIAFAATRMWHPGEKRQCAYVGENENELPDGFKEHIKAVLAAAALTS